MPLRRFHVKSCMLVLVLLMGTLALGAGRDAPQAGLAAKYPGDVGIGKDPAVIFADDFEGGDLKRWDDKSGTIAISEERPHGGTKCVAAPMEKRKNQGGEAKTWFMPGADRV